MVAQPREACQKTVANGRTHLAGSAVDTGMIRGGGYGDFLAKLNFSQCLFTFAFLCGFAQVHCFVQFRGGSHLEFELSESVWWPNHASGSFKRCQRTAFTQREQAACVHGVPMAPAAPQARKLLENLDFGASGTVGGSPSGARQAPQPKSQPGWLRSSPNRENVIQNDENGKKS